MCGGVRVKSWELSGIEEILKECKRSQDDDIAGVKGVGSEVSKCILNVLFTIKKKKSNLHLGDYI